MASAAAVLDIDGLGSLLRAVAAAGWTVVGPIRVESIRVPTPEIRSVSWPLRTES